MEEKVQRTLKLIEEEGDSFAKRAEMYYKNRPELLAFVQDSFQSYRALADRYDHLSTELQKANTTIATMFPEQVQFAMEEEEEYKKLKEAIKVTQIMQDNIPKAPATGPVKQLKTMFSNAVKFQNAEQTKNAHKTSGSRPTTKSHKSGLSKESALAKIDKLQKQILLLQTEKEFLKSSYENGISKCNSIDKEINEMQDQVFNLQDEFGDGMFIEDEEARTLMSSAALKSCQDALAKHEKQKTSKDAKVEHKRVKATRKKLMALMNPSKSGEARKRVKSKEQKAESEAEEHRKELAMLKEKIKEHFEAGDGLCLNVSETAERIDELVNKVISLESEVSSQAALIHKLRTEIDRLQAQIQTLEGGDKASESKLEEMEEKLQEIEELDQSVQDKNNNLETNFTEARCNLDHLSTKLSSIKTDEEINISDNADEESSSVDTEPNEQETEQNELERQFKDGLSESTLHLKDLKTANDIKDEEIRSLRQKLDHLQKMFNTLKDGTNNAKSLGEMIEEIDDMKFDSPIDEKFRGDINALQERNLDFWLRFSTSFHQIQKFETEYKDLEADVTKLKNEKKSDINDARKCAMKTEARSIYKHLREIETELSIWLEENALLRDESQSRLSSLCDIEEEITKALQSSGEDEDSKFTKFQAAKFEGELLNMKQENRKVRDELEAGSESVKSVQVEVEQSLKKLNDEFGIADVNENVPLQRSESRNRVPLSSFLFGVKPKKQKQSFFSVVTPALNMKYIIK